MTYDFDKPYDRMGSDSIKWEKQLKFGVICGLQIRILRLCRRQ